MVPLTITADTEGQKLEKIPHEAISGIHGLEQPGFPSRTLEGEIHRDLEQVARNYSIEGSVLCFHSGPLMFRSKEGAQ